MEAMKKAMFFEKKENKKVQCKLCPHKCVISEGKFGICGARKNVKGELYSLVYGRPCSVAVDPIEKKPLFHFLPGSSVFSIGTFGCNLKCKFCQNWTISQKQFDNMMSASMEPEEVVKQAIEAGCKSIAYTYNEPTIFAEYVIDTAKFARKKGLKNIMVTNGYINKEPLLELYKYIDAANVDLKGFTDEFYMKLSSAHLQPVLDTLKTLRKETPHVWLEVTNLIIPTMNDNIKEIEEMCKWVKENLGEKTVIHFSRFFPHFQLSHLPPTDEKTIIKAGEIASKYLKYVYIGNMESDKGNNTYCPKCKKLLIERMWFDVAENHITAGKCKFCGEKIEGVWQ